MGVSDWLLAVPGAYLVLVLRGAMPLVISAGETFVLMAGLFAFAAWPHVARGVRRFQRERVRWRVPHPCNVYHAFDTRVDANHTT